MEYTPKKCKKALKKDRVNFYKGLYVSSQTSLSSKSDPFLQPFKFVSIKSKRNIEIGQSHKKHDYLTRLFERKKLKDKSLSKKMKTPFDRKLNRTCWPIELGKVSKIKKKPTEKRKGKPTQRSLKRKKFSKPAFITSATKAIRRKSSSSCSSGSGFIDDDHQTFNVNHFLYEPVTPQMLLDVLQDPEHLKSGANIDMIIAKLMKDFIILIYYKDNQKRKLCKMISFDRYRNQGIAVLVMIYDLAFRSTGTLKLDLNPSQELLKDEVLRKLCCAIKLGLVKENKGYYRIAENIQMSKLPRKKKRIWEAWCRNFPRVKR